LQYISVCFNDSSYKETVRYILKQIHLYTSLEHLKVKQMFIGTLRVKKVNSIGGADRGVLVEISLRVSNCNMFH